MNDPTPYTERRFARSTREAFAHERYGSVSGPYRRRRAWGLLANAGFAVLLGILGAAVLFLALSS